MDRLNMNNVLAEHGDMNAQFSLGEAYRKGIGISYDEAESIKWYRKAAEQGHKEALYWVGFMYSTRCDDAEAVRWYRKAAEQENYEAIKAQFRLGRMYTTGTGVAQDLIEADKWYRKARDSQDRLDQKMTPEQIAGLQQSTNE